MTCPRLSGRRARPQVAEPFKLHDRVRVVNTRHKSRGMVGTIETIYQHEGSTWFRVYFADKKRGIHGYHNYTPDKLKLAGKSKKEAASG